MLQFIWQWIAEFLGLPYWNQLKVISMPQRQKVFWEKKNGKRNVRNDLKNLRRLKYISPAPRAEPKDRPHTHTHTHTHTHMHTFTHTLTHFFGCTSRTRKKKKRMERKEKRRRRRPNTSKNVRGRTLVTVWNKTGVERGHYQKWMVHRPFGYLPLSEFFHFIFTAVFQLFSLS